MNITGNYLYTFFKKQAGMPYTSYLDPVTWNRFMEKAIIDSIDDRFSRDQSQKWKDELSGFIATNVLVQNIGNNSLNIAPIAITAVTVTGGTTWTIETNIPFSSPSVLQKIDIQGMTSKTTLTYPNGVQTITSIGKSVKGNISVSFTTSALTGTASDYVMNSGYFSFQNTTNSVSNQLIDYVHLLNIKCKFTKPINNVSVVSSTNGTPIVVSLNWYNNFRTSSIKNNVMVTMIGWNTNTSANGSFFIKVINDLQFQLYSDIELQNPVVGIANETNNDITLGLTYYNSANKYISTQKGNLLSQPTWDNPGFELAAYRINLYPMNTVNNVITTPCTEVTIDYVCKPKLPYVYAPQNDAYSGTYIDANDTNFDLTTIASEKWWMSVTDRAAYNYSGGSARDSELAQATASQLQNNP